MEKERRIVLRKIFIVKFENDFEASALSFYWTAAPNFRLVLASQLESSFS